jgi:hypothetical protein
MSQTGYVVSGNGNITVQYNGNVSVVEKSHKNYDAIKAALKGKEYDKLDSLINVSKPVAEHIEKCHGNKGRVAIEGGVVTFLGQPVHNVVTERMLQFVEEQFDITPLTNFLDKLMDNPSKKSLDNLYRFLEYNSNPILEDGCFLAYKRVRDDYMDFHAGKFDNSVGNVVEMPRNAVEDDPTVTCAPGLHVAALSYARDQYHSGCGRLVVVKVDPKDVVSVPTDYNNTKMRVCKYEVVEEFEKEYHQEDFSDRVDDDDDYEDEDEDYDDENDDVLGR